jgi:hypothetical protein
VIHNWLIYTQNVDKYSRTTPATAKLLSLVPLILCEVRGVLLPRRDTMVHPDSKLLFSLAPIVCCRAAISGSFPSHHFPQVYLAFSLAFQHITKWKQKSNFFYFIKNSLLVCDVKYSSRRTKERRSLISPEAVAAVTRPFYLILIRQFPELIETGLLLSQSYSNIGSHLLLVWNTVNTSTSTSRREISYWVPIGRGQGKWLQAHFAPW